MRRLAIYCAAVWLLAGGSIHSTVAEAAEASSPWRRWAIVATPELRAVGLSDLLAAQLSQDDSIELVEREQIDLALRELDLATHFGADDTARRLELGKLLKADAMLLLSVRQNEGQSLVRLIVSDCVYGARLSESFQLMKEGQIGETAEWVAASLAATRARFQSGVKRLIAVPPLLSKNLTPEHDHLQAGYAALVAHSLGRQPGVAVVEIEEARAIGRELQLAGNGLKRAVVPLVVEADYAMHRTGTDGELLVRISARLKDANGIRHEMVRDRLTSDQIVELLSDELPRRILDLEPGGVAAPLSRRQQQRLLAERAAAFSAAGIFEHATALREASLLLATDDVDQRIALVLDYNRWQDARGRENVAMQLAANRDRVFAGQRVDEQTWEKTHAERLARFHMTAPHVEILVGRRQINPREANRLASRVVRAMMMNALATENEFGQQDKRALEEFFWRVYPQFPRLDAALRGGTLRESLRIGNSGGDPQTAMKQYQDWSTEALTTIVGFARCTAVGRSPNYCDDSRTLDHLFRFLTELPQRDVPLVGMARLTMVTMNELIVLGRLPIADVRAFYEKLKASDRPFNAVYARCGLLALAVHDGAAAGPLRAEVKELMAWLGRLDSRDPDLRAAVYAYRHELERLQKEIGRRTPTVQPRRSSLPASPIPPSDPSPPLSFTPTGLASPWIGMTRCDDAMDLCWSLDQVDVMTSQNALRTVFKLDVVKQSILLSDVVYSADWDGENIWVATMKSGIRLVSPTGEQLGHIDAASGLPPYDARQLDARYLGSAGNLLLRPRPLRLHPLGPGKCVAIGQFGGNQRLWFAMVDRGADGRLRVDVMHTATKVYDKSERSLADVETVFPLQWTIIHSDPQRPGRRVLLAGRALRLPDVTWPPLAIDLTTREVSLLGSGVPSGFERALPQLEWNGNLVAVRDALSPLGGIRTLTPPTAPASAAWSGRELVPAADSRRRQSYPAALAYQGAIYNPGTHWWRIGGDLAKAEVVNERPLAVEHRFEFYGVSANHGLVAWNRGDQLYRVSFPTNPAKQTDLADRYPFVPVAERQRHHVAVEAIRRQGGRVGTEWGVGKYPLARFQPPRWRTIVYLPEDWTGGDDGLERLSDLFNLCDLYAVQADIGDRGLDQIVRLKQLQELTLVGTKVTDDGIARLKSHSSLNFCHLESAETGSPLTDAAVAHIGQLPKLVAVKLAGRSFTDAALSKLEPSRSLRELHLHNTAISPAGLAALKRSKPHLRVSGPLRGGRNQNNQ